MADLESLIESVKTKIGELIQKPKMTDKLLQKPPFRFLHDTITAVTTTTGFGEGLYSGEELDSAAITDRNAKINYLDKIFNLVGICKVINLVDDTQSGDTVGNANLYTMPLSTKFRESQLMCARARLLPVWRRRIRIYSS
jgi:hypothetical protein